MGWKKLNSLVLLDELIQKSHTSPQIIFKHSTRCSISFMVWNRLEKYKKSHDNYILDVIGNRSTSNEVAARFGIPHQSPQILIIFKGNCIYDASHFNINAEELGRQVTTMQLA